jgi:putative transposase
MDFRGSHCERAMILWGVRWSGADPVSYRPWEERRKERGASVDPCTLTRWVRTSAPEVERQCRLRQRPGGKSWRGEETDLSQSFSTILYVEILTSENPN